MTARDSKYCNGCHHLINQSGHVPSCLFLGVKIFVLPSTSGSDINPFLVQRPKECVKSNGG